MRASKRWLVTCRSCGYRMVVDSLHYVAGCACAQCRAPLANSTTEAVEDIGDGGITDAQRARRNPEVRP